MLVCACSSKQMVWTCEIQRAKECVPISMWLWSWFDMVGMERVLTSSEWNGLCFRCVDGSWCYLATMVLPSCGFVWPRSVLVHLMRLYSFTHLSTLTNFPNCGAITSGFFKFNRNINSGKTVVAFGILCLFICLSQMDQQEVADLLSAECFAKKPDVKWVIIKTQVWTARALCS